MSNDDQSLRRNASDVSRPTCTNSGQLYYKNELIDLHLHKTERGSSKVSVVKISETVMNPVRHDGQTRTPFLLGLELTFMNHAMHVP